MNTESASSKNTDRQQLLSTLSKTESKQLHQAWSDLNISPVYTFLKSPEMGMVMVKARIGGEGAAFNMGEMTATRTVLQLESGEMGYGYTAGRNKEKAITIALIDACYQNPVWKSRIEAELLKPLQESEAESLAAHKEKVDSTKVNFFTMVRGE